VHFTLLVVVFCLDFGPFFFVSYSLASCFSLIYLFIYLFIYFNLVSQNLVACFLTLRFVGPYPYKEQILSH
jgi:hypothetical protein